MEDENVDDGTSLGALQKQKPTKKKLLYEVILIYVIFLVYI